LTKQEVKACKKTKNPSVESNPQNSTRILCCLKLHLSLGQATAAVVVAMVCAFFCDQEQVLQLAWWREKESRDVASSKL
jgi:hypothetical protein